MDELRLKLSSKLAKSIVAKLLSKINKSKTGYKVDIRVNDLDFWSLDGDTNVSLNLEAKLSSEEFNKILTSMNKD